MKEVKREICKKYGVVVSDYSFELQYDSITPEILEQLMILRKNPHIELLISSIYDMDDKLVAGIIKSCTDVNAKNALLKLSSKMSKINEFDGETIFKYISNPIFINYVNNLDNSYFKRNFSLYNFMDDFKETISIKNYDKNVILLNEFVKDPLKSKYKITDMEKYEDIREKYFIDLIKESDYKMLDKIISSYFNYSCKEFNEIIEKVKKMNIKVDNRELYDYITHIDIYSAEQLIDYIKVIKKYPHFFDKIEKDIKKKSIESITSSLTKPSSNDKTTLFNGQPFTLLIHKVCGMLDEKAFNLLNNDMSNWNKYYDQDGYISCSLIDELFFGFVSGDNVVLGFSNITPDDILAMNSEDTFFTKNDIIGNYNDKASNYMSKDLLLEKSIVYNEIDLRRYRGKEAIMPDCVVSFNVVTEQDQKASEQLNIPICLIDVKEYAYLFIEMVKTYLVSNPSRAYMLIERLKKQNCANPVLNEYYDIILNSDVIVEEISETKGDKYYSKKK